MDELFLNILNMSITATWITFAVIILRFIIRKGPKWINCILWMIVGIRLLVPFSLESRISLIPSAKTFPPSILLDPTPTINSGIPALNSAVNPILSETQTPGIGASVNPLQITTIICSVIWFIGIGVMLIYMLTSYLKLCYKVRESIKTTDNVMLCDHIDSPFILGVFRPKIYMPSNINESDVCYVMAHERAHLKRHDHLWKPLGFLLLILHWFNPMMWIAYILLCRDIEYACDEMVISKMGTDSKKPYSEALIECSISRKSISACPLAFGEVSVKNRIKTVLNYKKPAFYVIIAALILCITVSACFLTDPLTDYSEQYKDMALGVMIVDHEGTIATTDPWYNYFDIKKFDDVTMPATYSIDISIRKISKDYITISFNEKLLLDDTAVSKIKLKPGESVTLSTMTTGGGTTYTFFITEWSKVSEGGIYHPQTGDVLQKLTLDDVIELSKKGATLSWEDFEPYYYYETGMGLYIRAYPINDMFQVSIGSTIGINYAPLYIYITANDGLNTFHDIRYSGVEEYINKHKQNPIVKSCSYGFTCSPVGSSDIVGKMLEQVVNISNMIKSSTGALPLVKIENRAELEEFLAETESLIDQNKTYPDVLPFSETIYNYDNEFFESETLFLLYITAPSTAHRYNINYINKSEGVLKFGISAIEPQTGDTAMEGWIMAIGIPTYQISDVSTFEARLVSPLS